MFLKVRKSFTKYNFEKKVRLVEGEDCDDEVFIKDLDRDPSFAADPFDTPK